MEIVFTRGNKISGMLVRYFSKGSWIKSAKFNHCAVKYSDEEGNWMVEAGIHGFAPNFWPRYEKKAVRHARFRILKTDEKILESVMEDIIQEYLFVAYDVTGFIGFGLTTIWYWLTGKQVTNIFGRKNSFVCSEIAYRYLRKIGEKTGIEYVPEKDPECVWPDELYFELLNKPELFREIKEE